MPFPFPQPAPSKVKGAQRTDFTNTFPADYRELLALPTGRRPGDITARSYFRPALHPEPYESDRLLIALLDAETQLGAVAVEECRRRIQSQWPRYSAEMKAWLQKKLGVDSLARSIEKESSRAENAALLAIPAGVSDFQAVEKVLEDAASSIRKGGAIPLAEDLLLQWRKVTADVTNKTSAEEPYRFANWSGLSAHPGGVALMAARDRALREASAALTCGRRVIRRCGWRLRRTGAGSYGCANAAATPATSSKTIPSARLSVGFQWAAAPNGKSV